MHYHYATPACIVSPGVNCGAIVYDNLCKVYRIFAFLSKCAVCSNRHARLAKSSNLSPSGYDGEIPMWPDDSPRSAYKQAMLYILRTIDAACAFVRHYVLGLPLSAAYTITDRTDVYALYPLGSRFFAASLICGRPSRVTCYPLLSRETLGFTSL